MKNDDTKFLIVILLVAGLLLVAPYFIRIWNGNPHTINSETYYNLRLYNTVDSRFYDQLQERNIPLNIMYLLPFRDNYGFLITKILTFFLGLASVLLGYIIMKRHNMTERNIWAVLLLLIASPIFIYTFIDFNFYAIIIFLSLLVILFLQQDRIILAGIIFFLTPFIDIYGAIISFIFILIYIISNNNSFQKHRFFIISTAAAIILSVIINTILGYNIFSILPFEKSNIITDIGADIGFSFSSIILSAIGLILLWEKGWKNLVIYLSVIILLVLAVFNNFLRIYLNFVLAIYAGFAFIFLMRRKWSIALIKKITILLIVCSILFTTLVYTTKLVKSAPNPDYVDALGFLNKQSLSNESVLSSVENGYMIEYYSERNAFIDGKTIMYSPGKNAVFENISSSRNLDRTESLLEKYQIKYIFIDSAFRQYLEERQGLLFLIDTSNKFKSIYKNNNIEIWMYTGKESNAVQ